MKTRPDTNPAAQNGVDAGRRNALKLAGLGVATLGMMPLLNVSTAKAQDMSNGANNFYTSDKVTVQKVTFKNQYQMNVAGNLFTPEDAQPECEGSGHRRRASDGRGEGAKRQSLCHEDGRARLRRLVPRLAVLGRERGPAAQPRFAGHLCRGLSAPRSISSALRPFVDRNRIGAIGICGSGSFVISAAKIDPRMKAIATVSMYDMGAANRNALRHSQTVEQRKQIIAAAAEQRYVEFTGGEAKYTSGTVHELTASSHPIEREFYDFYRTPRGEFTPKGSSPQLTTHPTLTSNVKFMNFYPFNDIETISPRPMLFITGDKAHSREFSEDAYKRAAEPKELVYRAGRGPRRSLRPREPHPVRQAGILLQSASRRLGAMSARFEEGRCAEFAAC